MGRVSWIVLVEVNAILGIHCKTVNMSLFAGFELRTRVLNATGCFAVGQAALGLAASPEGRATVEAVRVRWCRSAGGRGEIPAAENPRA